MRPVETLPVLRELRVVLTEARQPPGREAKATFSEVAGKLKQNDNVIRKFEKGETAPNYERVDALVEAYATTTGVSPIDLWREAVDRAAKAEAKLKRGLGSPSPTEEEPAARTAAASKRARDESVRVPRSRKGRRTSG